jgi:hypothetical protein
MNHDHFENRNKRGRQKYFVRFSISSQGFLTLTCCLPSDDQRTRPDLTLEHMVMVRSTRLVRIRSRPWIWTVEDNALKLFCLPATGITITRLGLMFNYHYIN